MAASSKSSSAAPLAPGEVDYPDSDGEPIADDTRMFEWIVLLKENLDAMLPDFVARDLFWYPVEGHPEVRLAPDVLVALGRPKGHRGSYMQFREDGVPPAVVFEVLSARNTVREMIRKGLFYSRHGAREFIVIDPEQESGWAYLRSPTGETEEIPDLDGWTSPILGIRFVRSAERLEVYRPNGTRFLSFREAEAQLREIQARTREIQARTREIQARTHEAQARFQEAQARIQADTERARRFAAQLAALGVDPEAD